MADFSSLNGYNVKDKKARNDIDTLNSNLIDTNNVISALQNKVNSVADINPLVASSVENMTDTTRIYVNTTDGNWYYYNGTAWAIGGVYQATVEDVNNDYESMIFNLYNVENNLPQTMTINNGYGINADTGASLSNRPKRARTLRNNTNTIKVIKLDSEIYTMKVFFYSSNTITWENCYLGSSTDFGDKFYIGNYSYFAVLFKRVDEADLTDEDITAIRESLHYYALTDKTLTEENKIADSKTVGDKINYNKSYMLSLLRGNNNEYIENTLITFVNSGIYTSNGVNHGDVDNRCRTGRITRNRADIIKLDTEDYQMAIFYYNAMTSNSSYGEDYAGVYEDWANEFIPNVNYPYFALTFKKADNSEMNVIDLQTIEEKLSFTILTDKTLSLPYVPADSKTVGDRISNLNMYNYSFSMYKKLGFVGDSRTSGFYYYTNSSSPIENRELSWGANLARRNGCEYGIYAVQGQTTKGFLTHSKCLPKLLSDTPCNLYFLCLGGNDAGSFGLDYLGTIDDIKEDYHNNPDTFYGNYARIIEQIKEHSPNCKFIMAMFHYYTRWHSTTGNRHQFWLATKEIAEHYGIPFLDWTKDKYYETDDFVNGIRHNHPSVMQYSAIAVSCENLFKDLVNENYEYFIQYTE